MTTTFHTYTHMNSLRRLAGKKVLITGAKGFIGSHLLAALQNENIEIHTTSRHIQPDKKNGNITGWQGTLQDESFASALFSNIKPDIIFHLAGDATAANEVAYVSTTYHSLLTSTINVLTLADKWSCERVVLAGSSTEPAGENPVPNSPYAAAKWATMMYGKMFCELYQLPVVLIRPFMGYGPGQSAGKIIPFVINSFIGGKAPLLSNGYWITDWVYIKDTVQALVSAAVAEECAGIAIDLGTGILTSVREIVEKITGIMKPVNGPVFGALPDRHVEHTRMADTETALDKLNWKAVTTLDDGLRQTIDWYINTSALKKH